jgi:hypothetical protein
MLLHRQRIISAALHSRVVGDDHAQPLGDTAHAGDETCGRHWIVVDLVRRKLGEFEERRAGIEQMLHPVAHEELAALDVALTRLYAAALARRLNARPQVVDQRAHRLHAGIRAVHGRLVEVVGPFGGSR